MEMWDCLSRYFSAIDTDVVSVRMKLFVQILFEVPDHMWQLRPFIRLQRKDIGLVPCRDDERVAFVHREIVKNNKKLKPHHPYRA